MKSVDTEVTVLRLCRALRSLAELEETLGRETPVSAAADEVHQAVLDLCGVPEDTTISESPVAREDRWCRDSWTAELNEIVTPDATDDDLAGVLPRLQALNREAIAEEASLRN